MIAEIISLTMLVLQILNVNYLYSLEEAGCECAMDFKRKYIMIYTGIFVVYSLLSNLVAPAFFRSFAYITLPVILVAGIVNVVYTLQYVRQLQADNCKCSESVYREILYAVGIINAVSYGILGLLTLLALEAFVGLGSKKRSSRK